MDLDGPHSWKKYIMGDQIKYSRNNYSMNTVEQVPDCIYKIDAS